MHLDGAVASALTQADGALTRTEADRFSRDFKTLLERHADAGPAQTAMLQFWSVVSKQVLQPAHPFALHTALFRAIYKSWPAASQGPAPVWIPDQFEGSHTNLAHFMTSFKGNQKWQDGRSGDPQMDWPLLYEVSCSNPEVFWPPVLKQLKIPFHTPPCRILQMAENPDQMRWLPDARLNIAEAAVCSRPESATAIIWADEAAPDQLSRMTLGELKSQCQHVAAALHAAGYTAGDAIAINMPMTVHAVVIYLGIIYAGCAAVSIADSFAPSEISTRLEIAHAKAIFVQDVIQRGGKAHPLYQRVVQAKGPKAIVLPAIQRKGLQVRLRKADVSFEDFLATASAAPGGQQPHMVDAYETCNILFSSGTTGQPKAIPWTHVTPIRCAANAFFHHDVHEGDTVAWPTNLGWMMGPWLVFAALLNGATIALFQGSPLGRDFGVFVQKAGVSMLGLVPSIAKTWRATQCMKGLSWDKLRCFSSTGEASSAEDYHWLSAMAGYKPIMEYCGGTEIGGGFLSGTMVQPQAPSHFSTPTIGCRLALIDDQEVLFDSLADQSCSASKAVTGELALVPPLMGSSQRLLNKDHFQVYYEGMPTSLSQGESALPLRRHGDEVERLPGGFFAAHGRCDDTMNLGGIKVSSVELERVVIASVPSVLEAAAVGITPPGGGPEQLVMFLVLDKHSKTVSSAQASHTHTDTSSQPAAVSAAHQSATHEQESLHNRQYHNQSPESSSSSRCASSCQHSEPGSSSGHGHQPIPAQQDGSCNKPSSGQTQDNHSSGRTPVAAEEKVGSHAMAGQQDKQQGTGKATLTDAVATATSAAAGAVQRVGSAVSPLLKQAQHAAAPLTQQIQNIAAPVLAQVRDAALPAKQQLPDAGHAAAQHAETGTAPLASQVRDTATSARETVGTSAQTAADKAQAATESAQSVSQGVAADVFSQASAVATASVQYIKDKAQAAQEALAPQLDKAQQAVSDTAVKASSSSSDVTEQATEVAASACEQASMAADGVPQAAAPVTTQMSQAASDAKTKALEYASAAEPITGQMRSTAAAAWDKAVGTAAGAVNAIQGSRAWHQAVSSTVAAADAVRSSGASAVDAVNNSATGSAGTSKDEQPEDQAASGKLGLDGRATLGHRVTSAVSSAKRTAQDAIDTGRNWAASLGSESTLSKIDGAVQRTAQSAVAASQKGKQAVNAASTMIQQSSAWQAKAVSTGQSQNAATSSEAGPDLQDLKAECQKAIRTNLNPLFKLEQVFLRESLPRTASNKVMRRVLRDELRHTVAKL